MLRKLFMPAALSCSLLIAGCGGGGSDSSSSTSPPSTPARFAVAGPLNGVQQTLSGSVLTPLAVATQGTPLSGVISCADFAVNGDALNIVNALANGIQGAAQNPQAIANVAPQIQGAVQQLALDLQQLVGSLAGGAACNSSGSNTAPSGNPLSGTPLAALGDQLLPVLAGITQNLGVPAGAGGTSQQQSLSQLAGLLSQISGALSAANAQLPASVTGAPVLGGVLTTLQGTVTNLVSLVQTAASGDPAATTTALQSTVSSLLQNLLLNVLPVNAIQLPTGSTAVSNPVTAAIAQLTSLLGQGLGSSASASALPATLTTALSSVLGPLNQASGTSGATLLTSLLSQLTSGLSGVTSGAGGGNSVAGLTSALSLVTSTLSSLLGGKTGGCLFANTPLAVLCTTL
ncbi:MAG: hypothetical protein ACRETW_10630 [Stenotrophobium sp.]